VHLLAAPGPLEWVAEGDARGAGWYQEDTPYPPPEARPQPPVVGSQLFGSFHPPPYPARCKTKWPSFDLEKWPGTRALAITWPRSVIRRHPSPATIPPPRVVASPVEQVAIEAHQCSMTLSHQSRSYQFRGKKEVHHAPYTRTLEPSPGGCPHAPDLSPIAGPRFARD